MESIKIEALAEEFGLSEATLRGWRHRGDRGPKSFKLGGSIRYLRSDVDAWVREQYESTAIGGSDDKVVA